MSRLILSSVFFTSRFWRWWLWRTPSIYVFTLFTVLIRKVNKGNSSKNSFSRKKYGVCVYKARPLLFSCTHMHKKVLLIKIDQTYWHKISITAVHLCTPFDPYYLPSIFSVCCWPYKSRNSVPIFCPCAWNKWKFLKRNVY